MQDLDEREQLRKFSFGMVRSSSPSSWLMIMTLEYLRQYNFVNSFEGQIESEYWTKPVDLNIRFSKPDDALVLDEFRPFPSRPDVGDSDSMFGLEDMAKGDTYKKGLQVIYVFTWKCFVGLSLTDCRFG
jgi:hypothetical protein